MGTSEDSSDSNINSDDDNMFEKGFGMLKGGIDDFADNRLVKGIVDNEIVNRMKDNKVMKGMVDNKLVQGMKDMKTGLTDNALTQGIGGLGNKMFNMFDQDQEMNMYSQANSAQELKNKFMEKYSIQFDIPSLDVQSSTFYPRNTNLCLQCVNYVVPRTSDYDIQTHYLQPHR